MDLKKILETIFLAVLTGSSALCVAYVGKMSDNLQKVTVSVQELNGKMDVIYTKMVYTDEIIRDHEGRIRALERLKSN